MFFIATDHKPLTFAIKSASSKFSPRESRHLAYIAEFTTDVRHVQGSANAAADALSRLTASVSCAAAPATVDFSALASAQAQDEEIAKLRLSPGTLEIREVTLPSCTVPILCDMSTGNPRPVVPSDFRRAVFDSLHTLSHPGIRATQHLITQRFVWPGINKDVRAWTRSCLECQQSKVYRHTCSPYGSFTPPSEHFDKVHLDILGPWPPSDGKPYLQTCIDRFTRWPEAFPIPDIRSETIAKAFVSGWVSRFGVPSTITTDRGRQFESALFKKLMVLLGSSRTGTTCSVPPHR